MDRELVVRITDHAHEQYCKRVEQIDRSELRERMTHSINNDGYHKSNDFIHITGIWWVCEVVDDVMILITCYGRTDFDLPRALKWARVHDDRIKLDQ